MNSELNENSHNVKLKSELEELIQRKHETSIKLLEIERNIYNYETIYLTESRLDGNIVSGYHSGSSRSAQRSNRSFNLKDSERIFSNSSSTAVESYIHNEYNTRYISPTYIGNDISCKNYGKYTVFEQVINPVSPFNYSSGSEESDGIKLGEQVLDKKKSKVANDETEKNTVVPTAEENTLPIQTNTLSVYATTNNISSRTRSNTASTVAIRRSQRHKVGQNTIVKDTIDYIPSTKKVKTQDKIKASTSASLPNSLPNDNSKSIPIIAQKCLSKSPQVVEMKTISIVPTIPAPTPTLTLKDPSRITVNVSPKSASTVDSKVASITASKSPAKSAFEIVESCTNTKSASTFEMTNISVGTNATVPSAINKTPSTLLNAVNKTSLITTVDINMVSNGDKSNKPVIYKTVCIPQEWFVRIFPPKMEKTTTPVNANKVSSENLSAPSTSKGLSLNGDITIMPADANAAKKQVFKSFSIPKQWTVTLSATKSNFFKPTSVLKPNNLNVSSTSTSSAMLIPLPIYTNAASISITPTTSYMTVSTSKNLTGKLIQQNAGILKPNLKNDKEYVSNYSHHKTINSVGMREIENTGYIMQNKVNLFDEKITLKPDEYINAFSQTSKKTDGLINKCKPTDMGIKNIKTEVDSIHTNVPVINKMAFPISDSNCLLPIYYTKYFPNINPSISNTKYVPGLIAVNKTDTSPNDYMLMPEGNNCFKLIRNGITQLTPNPNSILKRSYTGVCTVNKNSNIPVKIINISSAIPPATHSVVRSIGGLQPQYIVPIRDSKAKETNAENFNRSNLNLNKNQNNKTDISFGKGNKFIISKVPAYKENIKKNDESQSVKDCTKENIAYGFNIDIEAEIDRLFLERQAQERSKKKQ